MAETMDCVLESRAKSPPIRTVRQTARETGVPEHLIRAGIREGWVPGFPRGNRFYVQVDRFLEYLNGDCTAARR